MHSQQKARLHVKVVHFKLFKLLLFNKKNIPLRMQYSSQYCAYPPSAHPNQTRRGIFFYNMLSVEPTASFVVSFHVAYCTPINFCIPALGSRQASVKVRLGRASLNFINLLLFIILYITTLTTWTKLMVMPSRRLPKVEKSWNYHTSANFCVEDL